MSAKSDEKSTVPELAEQVETADVADQELEDVSGGGNFSDMNIYQNGGFYTGGDIKSI